MELYLQGLSNLEGVVGASNSVTVDFSQSEFDTQSMFDFAGSLGVSSGAVVGGSAN